MTADDLPGARPPAVRPLRPGDVGRLASGLGRAFVADPIWEWIYPSAKREQRLARMFRSFLTETGRRGATVVSDEGLRGAAIWQRSEARDLGPLGTARMGVAMAAGGARVRRGIAVLRTVERHHPREPHWYLALLGTDPDHQGSGVGTALVRHVVDDPAHAGEPAYLETETEANVSYYSRLGFEVIGETDVPGGGPHLWFMWRDARP